MYPIKINQTNFLLGESKTFFIFITPDSFGTKQLDFFYNQNHTCRFFPILNGYTSLLYLIIIKMTSFKLSKINLFSDKQGDDR